MSPEGAIPLSSIFEAINSLLETIDRLVEAEELQLARDVAYSAELCTRRLFDALRSMATEADASGDS